VERIAAAWRERLGEGVLDVVAASAVTGAGIDELSRAILAAVPPEGGDAELAGARPGARDGEPEFEAEHRTYRPAAEQGFTVERVADRAYRIEGRGIEVLVRRHDLHNEEALAYLEQRLREIGVIAALEAAGFEPGDEVRIGEQAFDLHPG
jgi:GTP-binding protein